MVNCTWPRLGRGEICALRMVVKCGKVKDQEGVYVENVVYKELLHVKRQ